MKYFIDAANAAASADPFVRTLERLAANMRAAAIDVLAYSACAQIVSPGLARVGQARPGESREQRHRRLRLRLGQIYFAAPGIDTRRFVQDLSAYVDVVDRVSMAANLSDSALPFAKLVHRSSRAGRPNPTELDATRTGFLLEASRRLGFDLIRVDPNDIPKLPEKSHAFWYEDPWVSSDLLSLMLLNAEPQRRGLAAQSTEGGVQYWTVPPDFDLRGNRLFAPAAPTRPGLAPR